MKPIVNAPGTPPPGYLPTDDLRHRAAPGQRTRDSLFWQCVMPEEKIGFQAYLYSTSDGKAGFNVVVMGPERKPLALDLVQGEIPDSADFDDFSFHGLKLIQPANSGRAHVTYSSHKVTFDYAFEGIHQPFSYHQNPDGLPDWFAVNRLEQSGWVKGFIEFGGRRIELDRIGHRDHSWGMRQWSMPQHWKWLIGYTPDGSRMVNAWIWIARGEWGVGGYVVRDGVLTPISHVTRQRARYDADMRQEYIDLEVVDTNGQSSRMEMERFAIVKLPAGGRLATMIMEAACSVTIDGQAGAGQFETQWPQVYLDRLKELDTKE